MKKLITIMFLFTFLFLSSCTSQNTSINRIVNNEQLQERIQKLINSPFIESSLYFYNKTTGLPLEDEPLIYNKSVQTTNGKISKVAFTNSLTTRVDLESFWLIIDETQQFLYLYNNPWQKIDMRELPNSVKNLLNLNINQMIQPLLSNIDNLTYIEDTKLYDTSLQHYTIEVNLLSVIKLFYNTINEYHNHQLPEFETMIQNMKNLDLLTNCILDIYIDESTQTIYSIHLDFAQLLDFIVENKDQIPNYLQNDFVNGLEEYYQNYELAILFNYNYIQNIYRLEESVISAPTVSPVVFTNLISSFNLSYKALQYVSKDVIHSYNYGSVIHPTKPLIYLLESSHKSLTEYNIDTKETRTVSFLYRPERMVISGDKIYVTLLNGGHRYSWRDQEQRGAYAIIDTNTFTEVVTVDINLDPYDIAVDNNGHIFISGGSDQWTNLNIYSPEGILIGQTRIYYLSNIKYNSMLDKIYIVDTQLTHRYIKSFKYDYSLNTFTEISIPYERDYPIYTSIYIDPNGRYLFNDSGVVFTCSDSNQDLTYFTEIIPQFRDIAFNLDNNEFYVLYGSLIYIYNYDTFTLKDSVVVDASNFSIYYQNNAVYLLGRENGSLTIKKLELRD